MEDFQEEKSPGCEVTEGSWEAPSTPFPSVQEQRPHSFASTRKSAFISPSPAEREGRQLGTALGEQGPDPGLQESEPAAGQEALAEAAQCLEVWPWLKLDELCSLRMGRVWWPEDEEENTVGEKRRGKKRSGIYAGPTQGGEWAGGSGEPRTLRSLTFSGRIGMSGCVLGVAVGEKRQSN